MNTPKQEEMIASFLSMLGDDVKPLYQQLIAHLTALGYHPCKEKSSISFKHDLHNKQIAKISMKKNGEHPPYLALRFSACRNYSKKMSGVVAGYMLKYPARAARCVHNGCNFCSGDAITHVYTYTTPDGERKTHCGAYAIELPDITPDDMEEIRKLMYEEHQYLLKHEAGTGV